MFKADDQSLTILSVSRQNEMRGLKCKGTDCCISVLLLLYASLHEAGNTLRYVSKNNLTKAQLCLFFTY